MLFLISCGTSKVVSDYDSKTDFKKYKTFDFYEDNGESLNEFDVKRITTAIESELKNAGMNYNSNPDFFIYFDAKTSESRSNNTIGIGIGSGGRNGGIGISGGIPIGGKKLNEEISIRFIEAKNNKLFWEGSLTSSIKENRKTEERKLHLQQLIKKIISEYPPSKSY
ncbi:DUF4136 domain-containing protein [Polaribacter pectinis]|uniref:DUF4136 domain-containing protein n=1 Tax=Polaribacter pectinis TaxID=2738844 RepID=A0A7G9L6N3_9FLAO|nr:DUF4136 domain-containing protein [Polaribacter pectinis]QNM84282.1 DUF4136 domain-containing protein [Polaribacter pectinis]